MNPRTQSVRWWVGWLAILAPLPLPFNDLLEWPLLAVYSALLLLWLAAVRSNRFKPLPRWVVNVLGLAYLVLLPLDVTGLSRGSVLRPVLHLLLFGLLVKIYGIRRDRELWQLLLTSFFVFVASMATSVHPTVIVYLVLWLALAVLVMSRLTWIQALSGYGVRGQDEEQAPFGRLVAGTTLGAVVLAVPLFFLLPRTGSPIVTGPAVGGGGGSLVSGMSDEVGLDAIGRIRQSRAVVLRMEQTPATPDPRSLRFKVATYSHYADAHWRAGDLRRRALGTTGDGVILLRRTPPVSWAELWIQPLGTTMLPMPMRAVAIGGGLRGLALDSGGGLYLFYIPSGTLRLKVGLARTPDSLAQHVANMPADAEVLNTAEVTPRMSQLARRIAGGESPAAASSTLESYLSTRYAYTTDLVAGSTGNPLEDFLFETRRGHCEYFASSMVLLLRSLGVPARLVTGFLGAELNPIEDYLVVRQSNAHAWVEAWLPDQGWTTFDPTPPAGRPQAERIDLRQMLSQAWDLLVFRWDRYVIGYGLNDQIGAFWRFRQWIARLRLLFSRAEPTAAEPAEAGTAAEPGRQIEESAGTSSRAPWVVGWIVFVILLSLAGLWVWLRRRRTVTATDAWIRLLEVARTSGHPIRDATPPLAAGRELGVAFPAVARSIDRLVMGYLEESFGGWTVPFTPLRADLEIALKGLRSRP